MKLRAFIYTNVIEGWTFRIVAAFAVGMYIHPWYKALSILSMAMILDDLVRAIVKINARKHVATDVREFIKSMMDKGRISMVEINNEECPHDPKCGEEVKH